MSSDDFIDGLGAIVNETGDLQRLPREDGFRNYQSVEKAIHGFFNRLIVAGSIVAMHAEYLHTGVQEQAVHRLIEARG